MITLTNKKYYIIDGKTGDILFYTDDNTGYPSVWETVTGSPRNYYTHTTLPEERETRTRIYKSEVKL